MSMDSHHHMHYSQVWGLPTTSTDDPPLPLPKPTPPPTPWIPSLLPLKGISPAILPSLSYIIFFILPDYSYPYKTMLFLLLFKKERGKKTSLGLPWWRIGWESACHCRRHGFEPWSGKIPHAAEQLGPWATTTEPARLEPALRNKRGCDSERPTHRNEEWPPLAATRESPGTETKTQHSHK